MPMNRKLIYQGTAFAAAIAFVAIVIQAIASFSLPAGVQVQPGLPLSSSEFLVASTDYADITLGFFGADTLFVLSYLIVFAGIYTLTRETAPPFAMIGLLAGVFTALMDTVENGYFITYALAGRAGVTAPAPDFMLPFLLGHLKWAGAFATLYIFGVAFPRRTLFDKILLALMLLFPLIGVLGIANPLLVALRGLFFLGGMPLFAIYFWRESQKAD